MKNMRINTLKLMVLIALFCPAAFADGEMGGGGLHDTGSVETRSKTVIIRTPEEGEMGGGGRAATSYLDYLMDSVYDYFDRLM